MRLSGGATVPLLHPRPTDPPGPRRGRCIVAAAGTWTPPHWHPAAILALSKAAQAYVVHVRSSRTWGESEEPGSQGVPLYFKKYPLPAITNTKNIRCSTAGNNMCGHYEVQTCHQ